MLPFFKKSILLAGILTLPVWASAAEGSAAGGPGNFNMVLFSLLTLIIVLLLAIMLLGQVLRMLTSAYRDKIRAARKTGSPVTPILAAAALLLPFNAGAAEGAAVQSMISGIPAGEFYLLISILGIELLIILVLTVQIRTLVQLLRGVPDKVRVKVPRAARIPFWDRFNKVVPIEKEADIMLDHDYDGIRELDNNLPPWWKYGFYISIIAAVVYLWYYHGGGNGPSSHEEYLVQVARGEAARKAYLAMAANNVDENTVEMMGDADIAAGQRLYATNCAACHAGDGGGTVGPNLADAYWMHGGSISDIFKSIKYGWPDKGMKSWKDDFSPVQIAQITSFVKSLQGTAPAAPKEPQGNLYEEEPAAPEASTPQPTEGETF